MRRMFRVGLLSLIASGATVPAASAQNCCGGVGGGSGPRCGNSASSNCGGILGMKAFPFSDERYIRQFCGPHVAAGSCFGYFKPQITPWGAACPLYGDARADAAASGLYKYPSSAGAPREPQVVTPPATPPSPPKTSDTQPKPDLPREMPKSSPETLPSPKSVEPVKPPTAPLKPPAGTGASLPAIPEVPNF